MDLGDSRQHVGVSDRLTFQLYAASRAMVGAYRRELQAFNLTYTQYLTLQAIWGGDGRPVTELCEQLELDSGTVSPLLARLEQGGFISRERAGVDGRQVRVFCTEQGWGLRDQLANVPGGTRGVDGLSDDELQNLSSLLDTLRAAVRSGS
ncbi:MarR family transcriptional regulator [Leucobacter komagatae]|uniref:HTH-type transcriptional regulator MgrA n=1 Tax=Leucobacter komagatae TaxID=55969 RepID=A0A542Y882_9MICO|nr:MarR family transcriptional regulator [Leucobacter komagatae]TQL44227.1 MarR family transcriptional regulator [Leucobacter komagatae]